VKVKPSQYEINHT